MKGRRTSHRRPGSGAATSSREPCIWQDEPKWDAFVYGVRLACKTWSELTCFRPFGHSALSARATVDLNQSVEAGLIVEKVKHPGTKSMAHRTSGQWDPRAELVLRSGLTMLRRPFRHGTKLIEMATG